MPDRATIQTGGSSDSFGKQLVAAEEKAPESQDGKPRATMQNTYRLESKAPFDRDRVEAMVDQIMKEMLANAQYDPATSCKQAENVASEILISVKEMEFDRYRIIVIVTIYEKMFQGICYRSNSLWDSQRDDCVSCTFTNSSIVAVAVVYGVYYD